MSKIEECWVIQRDDGKYVNFMDNDNLTWYEHIWQATMTWDKWQAEKDIILWKLQNCRPVKVELRVVEADETITNLKKQLAEKQKAIDEINKEFVQAVHDWKTLCAEKDKEISRLKERLSVFDNFKDNYGYTNYDDSEILEDLQSRAFQAEDDTQVVNELLQFFNIFDENELVDKVKEPQTQLAIQELEKLRNDIWELYIGDYYLQNGGTIENIKVKRKDVCDLIDNQIKELKGEQYDKK